MKSVALAFAVMLMAAPAFAQDAAPVTPPAPPPPAMMPAGTPPAVAAPAVGEVKQDTQAIHETNKEIHDLKKERRHELKAGDKDAAKDTTKQIHDLKKERHEERKERRHDVKAHHPK